MNARELMDAFRRAGKRAHLVGDEGAGVIVGLDQEGRLYVVLDGAVLNRVNPEAIAGQSSMAAYLNPGGDGLWPAPEGSTLGYQYAASAWRVPPGLTSARYLVASQAADAVVIRAEIDLVNNAGAGLPTVFERAVRIQPASRGITVTATESITYLGACALKGAQVLLAPWSLAQFDAGPGCEVVFPAGGPDAVWDLYEPSDALRGERDGLGYTRTEGNRRYQIGLGSGVDWIELRDPRRGLTVRRRAEPLAGDLPYVDITDRPPADPPGPRGVRYSVYADANGFMEIEAAGGSPSRLEPGARTSLEVQTVYAQG